MKNFLKTISVILHPITVTIAGAGIIAYYGNESLNAFFMEILILIGIVVIIPLTTLYILKLSGVISDLDISKRHERDKLRLFLIFISVFLLDLYIVKLFLDNNLYIFMYFTCLLGYVIGFFISKRIKVSGHITTLVLNILFLGLYLDYYFLIALILVPVLFWSRVGLDKHKLHECFTGLALGSFVVYIIFLLT